MYESDFQKRVSSAIVNREVDTLSLKVTDSENAVIIEAGEYDAAYTAAEARKVARSIKCIAVQRWETDTGDIIEYLNDLADVVDGVKTVAEIESKWEGREIDTRL